MLRPKIIEQLFDIVDETTMTLAAELQTGYLHGMIESCQNITSREIRQNLGADSKDLLQKNYDVLEELGFAQEEVRKALQLAVLKGLKADKVANAAMTPDSIAFMAGYVLSKFIKSIDGKRVGDLTVGTGNFLTAILNQLPGAADAVYGVDPDPDLIRIAYVLADMQEHSIQFYQQSSLGPLFIDPLDAIVSDLPIGSATEEELTGTELSLAAQGIDYLPHLLIENHLNYLKPGGYGLYVIPNNLFERDPQGIFHKFLTKNVHIQALLQLPSSLFQAAEEEKSLFVIQKKGPDVRPVPEVLIARLPRFTDQEKISRMLGRIEDWVLAHKK